jgi:hypothetical protein
MDKGPFGRVPVLVGFFEVRASFHILIHTLTHSAPPRSAHFLQKEGISCRRPSISFHEKVIDIIEYLSIRRRSELYTANEEEYSSAYHCLVSSCGEWI